jgi:hypothetical protein
MFLYHNMIGGSHDQAPPLLEQVRGEESRVRLLAESAKPKTAAGPLRREKKARRTVLIADAIADRTITIGGILVIVAVLGILVFLRKPFLFSEAGTALAHLFAGWPGERLG